MEQFLLRFLVESLVISLLIVVLLVTFHLLSQQFSARSRYFIWSLLFVSLLIPVKPRWGFNLLHLPLKNDSLLAVTKSTASQVGKGSSQQALSFWEGLTALPWLKLLLICWLLGFIWTLGKQVSSYLKFRQSLKRWGRSLEDDRLVERLQVAKSHLGLTQSISILYYPAAQSPMLLGFKELIIVLPETDYTKQELDLIFEHELMHYKHHDLYINLLTLFTTSLYWFNPLIRLAAKDLQEAGELYCDFAVLQHKDLTYRSFYGETIITMIDRQKKQSILLSSCFHSNKLRLKRRLTAIMENRRPKPLLATIFSLITVLLLLSSGSLLTLSLDQSQTSSSLKEQNPKSQALHIALKDANLSQAQVQHITYSILNHKIQLSFETETKRYFYVLEKSKAKILSRQERSFQTNQANSSSSKKQVTTQTENQQEKSSLANTPNNQNSVSPPVTSPVKQEPKQARAGDNDDDTDDDDIEEIDD